jgi:hypothetical protein
LREFRELRELILDIGERQRIKTDAGSWIKTRLETRDWRLVKKNISWILDSGC